MAQHLTQKGKKEVRASMTALAQGFIGKECIVYTLEHQVIGVIREVSEGGILVESKDSKQAVNIDFILRIREYPKKPNGKKKGIILD